MRECINRTKTEAGSIWEVLKRRKLRTFKNQAKTMKVKIQEKVITLREECGLVTHLRILSKSRPGIIEFSELMKKHKFSVTPKSLFDPEGLPLQCTDRACFMKGLEELFVEITRIGYLRSLPMHDVIHYQEIGRELQGNNQAFKLPTNTPG